MKKLELTFIILGFLLIVASAGLAMDGDQLLGVKPPDEGFTLTVIENHRDERIVIHLTVKDLFLHQKHIDGQTFTVLSIPEAGYTIEPGKPMMPMIGQLLHISDSKAPHVRAQVIRSHTISIDAPILPAQEDRDIEDIQDIEAMNKSVYQLDSIYPGRLYFADDPAVMRDVRLLPLAIYPVAYNPQQHTLTVFDEIQITLTMKEEPSPNVLTHHGPYSPSWEPLYRALIPNYDDTWSAGAARNVPEHYLLIMPDAFENRCQGFITWKEQQGFIVDIIRLSELGSSPDCEDVYDAILTLYQSDERPVYASIIGSTNNFPVHQSHDNYMSGDFNDDLYYSQLEGDDLLPDIFLSRYPVVNPDELSIMMSRILLYEQNPPMDSMEYYKTALMACSGLYSSQQTTKEQTAGRLSTNLHYETIHTMYDWNDESLGQVISWIDQGLTIINYRGEGWRSGWHPNHQYDFEYDDVSTVQNGLYFPVITSIGCGVAMFSGYNECFGHAWVTLGSPGHLRGAVAFMGPTWNTRTTINNWIDRGIYRGFCYHDITRSSPAFNYGKIYAYTHFLGTDYMENDIPTHMREYILFGNPDLWWRTDVPRTAQVFHAWCPSSDKHGIVVIDTTGRKLANAQVCFLRDGQRRVYITDGGGGCRIYMNDLSEPVPYTLTGWNLLPCNGYFDLPETGSDGDLAITEIKPDIETTGTTGDKVEIVNLSTDTSVNLKGWTLGDLDGYDRPIINQDAVLGPHEIAVIVFMGYNGTESVMPASYGLYITSTALPGMSSLEDGAVLRNTEGVIKDAVFWHNGSGIGSTQESNDMSKLTQPGSPLSVADSGWWSGPDTVPREEYENHAVNWSLFAGNGGVGSIKRISFPTPGTPDTPSNFTVSASDDFGHFNFPVVSSQKEKVVCLDQAGQPENIERTAHASLRR